MNELEYPAYESSEVSAREIVQLLRRRRWTVLGTFVFFVVMAAVLTPMITPVYRARATMIIKEVPTAQENPREEGPERGLLQATQPLPLDTQVEVLQSGPLWDKVLERIGPLPRKATPVLSVAQRSTTNLIDVTVESTDPRVARDAPNLLVDEYIKQTEEDRGASLRKTREFVEQKLAGVQKQLAMAEARLRTFKERTHLTDLNSNREDAIKSASAMSEELRIKANELTSVRSQIRLVRAKLRHESATVRGSSTDVANPEVAQIKEQIRSLEMQRISMLEHHKETEPEVRNLDARIIRLQDNLKKQPATIRSGVVWQANPQRATLESQLDTLESQASGLEPQVARLHQQHEEARGRLVTFPAWEIRLAQLQRDRDQAQEDQSYLIGRRRDLRIREKAQAAPAQPMTLAALPQSPVRPQRSLNFLVAAALGLVFGIGTACLREMLDERIHGTDDLERLVDLPILGRVPTFPRRAPHLIAGQGESAARESFRRLRAGVAFASSNEPIRSLMVTSATAGEGKSTTASNLALAATLQGKKVILVDADLRSPSLSALLGVPAGPGLSDVLAGEASVGQALHPTSASDLLLLPAGSSVPDVAELLAGPRMEELVQELAGLADLVIFDTPPCLPVADAEVLGARVDAAIMVIGLGQTEKEAVRMARELLDRAHVRLLGVVVNRMKPGDQGYYYRYGTAPGAAGRDPRAAATAVVPWAREASPRAVAGRVEDQT